jgi:SEC-C motif-containing protein
MNNPCPCGSGRTFADCCEPLIKGERKAVTAEELMRSRYSAYATVAIDYLIATTDPAMRKYYSRQAIREWAEETTWLRLEIVDSTPTTVTFKAHFLNAGRVPEIHSEHSTFRQENGVWYFVEGKTPRQ